MPCAELLTISRAAIYFDGYLPACKGDVRLSRVVESSTASNKYFQSTKCGIGRDGDDRPPARQAYPRIPIPAFTVPSILEALRSSERYGHLTHVVPGEADGFCASHISREGGALLTSDSDLLLYDLGQTGSVVFFNDIEIAVEGSEKPSVLTYSQHAMCERLSLEPGQQAMLSLAFEIERDPYQKIGFWAAQSKTKCSANAYPAEYADFISEYVKGPDTTSLTIPEYLRFLDPRVSEFLLSWSEFSQGWTGNADVGSASSTDVSKTVGSIFYLPLLLDSWDHESAWSSSAWVRQLAYSFCPNTQSNELMVAEYRRTMSRNSNGQAVELLCRREMAETAHGLLSLCKITDTAAGHSHLRWVVFCLEQETKHASEQGKESLVKKLLQKASKPRGRLDPGSWDTVHLTAQIQGTLYSLRMLYQVLKCQGGPLVTTAWPQLPVTKMVDCLSTLPSIEHYPSITDVAALFGRRKDAEKLKALLDITDISEPTLSDGNGWISERMKSRASKQEQRKARPAASANPFDALSSDS